MKIDSKFEENLHLLLCEKKFNDILEILKDPENDTFVSENVWSIINSVCLTVKTNSLLKNEDDVILCKKLLLLLVSKGNPKEVLVSLLEQADSFKDHEFFCLLLEPLQIILKNTPGKRGKSLQWVLSTLNAHVETLNIPQDLDLQDEEKLLLDADPAVQDTSYVLSNYLNFIQFFVDEVSFEKLRTKEMHYFDRICNQQEVMHRYILKLFYHPLLYHDLKTVDNKPTSSIQIICKGYMNCLSKICPNVFNLYKYDCSVSSKDQSNLLEAEDEDDSVPLLAFSTLSYCIFVENLALDFQPFVYCHHFVFMQNLKYIIPLLKKKENLILFKGLHLSQALLNQIDDFQLNYDCMELGVFVDFPKLLLDVAIYSQIEAHRRLAFNIFLIYESKCNYKGRYHLIMQVTSTVMHSGAEGVAINLYKNNLNRALNGGMSSNCFLGSNLKLFLKKVFVLSEHAETDLLKDSDRIITALNFLRYLFLRDKKENNITGIWNLITYISENFLCPLRTGLDWSRAHYKEALKGVAIDSKSKKYMNTRVSVNNEVLTNVPVHVEKEIYTKGLMTYDVIESLLSRVKELMLS